MSSFVDCLVGYRSLYRLLLDNNKLGDSGAKALALALPHMMLGVLNIGFNEISTEGLLAIVRYLATPDNTLASLCLSGNTLDNTVAKELANILIVNTQLQELYVDRSNMTNVGERFLATGVASNKACPLRILTGFELGKVLTQLGSPQAVAQMNNEQALKYLCQVWRDLERTAALQQQQMRLQQQAGYLMAQGPSAAANSQAAMLMMMQQHHHLQHHHSHHLAVHPPPNNPTVMSSMGGTSGGSHMAMAASMLNSGLGSVGTSSPSEFSATEVDPSLLASLGVPNTVSIAATPPEPSPAVQSQVFNTAPGPSSSSGIGLVRSQFAISPVVIPEANAVSSTPAAVSSNVATGTATTPSAAAAGGLIGTTMVPGPIPLGGTVVPSVSSTQAFVAVPSAPAPPTASTPTPMVQQASMTFVPHPKRVRSVPGGSVGSGGGNGSVINRPMSSRPPSRTPPILNTRQQFQQQQLQQLQYQQQVERYHALLEAARQVPDLPFDSRELQVLTDFYYTPPSAYPAEQHMEPAGGLSPHFSTSTRRATTVTDMTKSSSSTTTVQQPLGPSGTTDMTGTTQVLVPTAANLAQLGRSQPSATYGQWRMGNTTTPASGTTYPIHSTVHGAMTATATDDDAISDTGTQTTAGHVHERSEEDDEGDASSSRPWKRASNLTTMPRINYFGRIKVHLFAFVIGTMLMIIDVTVDVIVLHRVYWTSCAVRGVMVPVWPCCVNCACWRFPCWDWMRWKSKRFSCAMCLA